MKLKRFTPLASAFGLTSAAAVNLTGVSTESLSSITDKSSASDVSTTELSSSSIHVAEQPKATVPGQIFPFTRTRPIIGTIYLKPYDSRPSVSWSSSSASTTTSEDNAKPSATPSWVVAEVQVNVHDEAVQDLKLKGPIDDFNTKDWDWVTLDLQMDDVSESSMSSTTISSTTPARSSAITTTPKQSETQIFVHMGEDGKLTEVTNMNDFPLTFSSAIRDTLATTTRETSIPTQPSKRDVQTTDAPAVTASPGKSINSTVATTTTASLNSQQIADQIARSKLHNFHEFERWSNTKYTWLTIRPHTSYHHTVWTRTFTASYHYISTNVSEFRSASTTTFTQPINTVDVQTLIMMQRENETMHSLMLDEWWRERVTACGFNKREASQSTAVAEGDDPGCMDVIALEEEIVSPNAEIEERAVDPACYDPNASKKGVICPRSEPEERAAVDPACYDPNATKKGVICPRPELQDRAVDPACYDPNASKKGVICPRPELDERVDPACFDPNADKKSVICPRPAV